MSESPTMEHITLTNGKTIDPVDPKEGYTFLGFKLSYSNDVGKVINFNLSSKTVNIIIFYAWLDFVKMKVLYACLFSSLL